MASHWIHFHELDLIHLFFVIPVFFSIFVVCQYVTYSGTYKSYKHCNFEYSYLNFLSYRCPWLVFFSIICMAKLINEIGSVTVNS